MIPTGSTSANIPVAITGVSSNPSTNPKTFQMLLLGGGGAARTFTASFSAGRQTFGPLNTPDSVTAADINCDGLPDLIVANYGGNTVSVLLNTTPAPTTTFDSNSFAGAQNFSAGSTPY